MLLSTLAPEKNFERLPRTPECTDRAQTSTTVPGRPSRVDLLGDISKSAHTKIFIYMFEKTRKKTRKNDNITIHTYSIRRSRSLLLQLYVRFNGQAHRVAPPRTPPTPDRVRNDSHKALLVCSSGVVVVLLYQ